MFAGSSPISSSALSGVSRSSSCRTSPSIVSSLSNRHSIVFVFCKILFWVSVLFIFLFMYLYIYSEEYKVDSKTLHRAKMLAKRELGNTGMMVGCIGFGASPLGNVFGAVSEPDAVATVREALRLGINFFDTSPYYGATVSEAVLGKCLKTLDVPRSDYFLSTKCGRYAEGFDFSEDRVTRSVEESLQRLGVDYVDILQIHDIEFAPSFDQIVEETIPALNKLRKAGKTRFVGITGLPLEIFTYVLDRVPAGSVDMILSYCHYGINDSTLGDLIPYLKSKGVAVISASPLAMGLLTDNGPADWHPASSIHRNKLLSIDLSDFASSW